MCMSLNGSIYNFGAMKGLNKLLVWTGITASDTSVSSGKERASLRGIVLVGA